MPAVYFRDKISGGRVFVAARVGMRTSFHGEIVRIEGATIVTRWRANGSAERKHDTPLLISASQARDPDADDFDDEDDAGHPDAPPDADYDNGFVPPGAA